MKCIDLKRCENPEGKLYCFCHAGGSALAYRAWSKINNFNVEVSVIELPNRVYPFKMEQCNTLQAYIDEIAALIIKDSKGLPFGVFGQSMGGIIAYELANIFEKDKNESLCWLGIASCSPLWLKASSGLRNSKHKLTDEKLIDYLIELDEEEGKLFYEGEFRKSFLPVVRNDLMLMELHEHVPNVDKISCPTLVFLGNRDTTLSFNEVNLWRFNTKGKFEVLIYDGGHNLLKMKEKKLELDVFRSFIEECKKTR
jgi:surfactin synthase thioesterase subunit